MRNARMTMCLAVVCIMAIANFASAEIIRGISIDFVSIGNAGNAADTQVMDDSTTGYGSVEYDYRIGKYEVTNAQWNAFTATVGLPKGNPSTAYDRSTYFSSTQQPTTGVSWYEALQFCNYLTSGDKSKGAYQFSGNNANTGNFLGLNRTAAKATYGTIYVLPTEDEWYKAAYCKPNGSGYSLFANGQSSVPVADNGWNYYGGTYSTPWSVSTGTIEQNGTFNMMGNVFEWNEATYNGWGGFRGGSYGGGYDTDYLSLRSSYRYGVPQGSEYSFVGFRIASIPEPTTLALFGLGGLILRRKK